MKVSMGTSTALIRITQASLFSLFGLGGTVGMADQVIEDILVTAQKRESSAQETPLAITALSNEVVEDRQIQDIRKIANVVPNLVFNQERGNGLVYMRGVGGDLSNLNTEPGVAMFVDGVYMGTVAELSSVLENIERIEVLRGPQGTLYGRNSTGGNINIHTKLPGEEPEFSASVLYGDHNRIKTSVSGGGQLIDDTLAARLAVVREEADGYRKNLFNGDEIDDRDNWSVAGSTVFTPSDTFEVILRADWSEVDQQDFAINFGEALPTTGPVNGIFLGGEKGTDPENLNLDQTPESYREFWGVSATVNWELADDLTLRSITAHRSTEKDSVVDQDGTSVQHVHITEDADLEAFTQEFNLLGNFGDNFEWILGAFYYEQDSAIDLGFDLGALQAGVEDQLGLPAGGLVNFGNRIFGPGAGAGSAAPFINVRLLQDSESLAFFAQGTYHVSERMRLTAGVRHTDDEKTLDQTFVGNIVPPTDQCVGLKVEDDWQETTYKLSVDYDLNENTLLYATHGTGYKAGGSNGGACGNTFDPELITSYELGVKSTLADGRLRLNAATYLYDYEDYHAFIAAQNQVFIRNAADVESYGFELEVIWVPIDELQIDGSAAFMKSEFEDFMTDDPVTAADLSDVDNKGNDTLRSPDTSYNFGIQYTHGLEQGGDVTLRFEASYKDDYYTDVFNNEFAKITSQTVQNLRLFWNIDEQWRVQAFVENLNDDVIIDTRTPHVTNGATIESYAAPRLWGLQVRYDM